MRAPRPVTPPTTRLTVVQAAAPAQTTGAASQMAAVLAEVLKVRAVGVDSHFFDELGADSMLMARFCAKLRRRPELPAVSIKDVYRHPTISTLVTALAPSRTAARSSTAVEGMAAVLAEVLEIATVPVDSHFFDDLGADSMLMARFCAKLGKRLDLPTVSIKDVYRHTTITALAAAFGTATAGPRDAAARPAGAPDAPALPDPAEGKMSRSKPHFFVCGLLQAVWILAFPLLLTFAAANGFAWVSTSATLQELYLRSLVYGAAAFVAGCLLPVLLKWLLVGRWKPRQFRVWSFTYFRFWLVRTVIQLDPLVRFAGSPVFSMYLRLLGAKIGRGVLVLTPTVPACPDMLTVGAGSVIRKDAVISGYRAVNGVIQTGRVTLGRDVVIGEMTVLDIATAMGDGAQLGHSSSLHAGQSVPAGAHWHGSPAEPTTVDYRTVGSTEVSFLRRFLLPLFQLAFTVGLTMPLVIGLPVLVFRQVPQLATLVAPLPPAIATWGFYRDALVVSTVLFFGLLLLRLLLIMIAPRILRVLVPPDREYRLYGVRYWAHRRIGRMTNNRYLMQLFG
ncbi:MAG: hypothetical protein JOY78_06380, partial [Pseudonocardia sp.]|nr:hypothetical protein [Pseudonocardia sp.]